MVFGTILATLLGGIISLAATKALVIDRLGQVVFNLVGLSLLFRLAKKPRPHVHQFIGR